MEDPGLACGNRINKRPALPHEENQMSLQGIPIPVVGSHLGCGKTTLLNELFAESMDFASQCQHHQ